MKGVFEFTDVPYNLRNQSKCNHSIPCTERYGIETASSIGPKLQNKVPTEIKIPNPLRNLKCELKVGFPETVLARYANCSLNMQATSNNDHSSMFHVRLYACNIFLFTFVLLLVNMKVTNLISLFPVIDNPAITRAFLFVYFFSFTKMKKENYIGYLHREELLF